jgi:hypothetical protein
MPNATTLNCAGNISVVDEKQAQKSMQTPNLATTMIPA